MVNKTFLKTKMVDVTSITSKHNVLTCIHIFNL